MGMRIERALKARDAAIMHIRDYYGSARMFGYHSDVINAHTSGTLTTDLKGCPAWVRSYVEGYTRRIRDSWWETELVFCHIAPDGTRYTAWKRDTRPAWAEDVDPLYKADRGNEISTWPHAHFWRESGKPFADPEVTTYSPRSDTISA